MLTCPQQRLLPIGQGKRSRMGLKGSSGDSRPNSEEGRSSLLSSLLMLGLSTRAAKRGKKQAGSVWEGAKRRNRTAKAEGSATIGPADPTPENCCFLK
ncbi:hypothetical protein E2320_022412 [Naja naja]|nr:hypothetical protein E2320_022412 [Naja naja]